ncbi:MAG: D-2-hydroxyacid dehydrogenase [Candidatus Limnocylindrales bacterium]
MPEISPAAGQRTILVLGAGPDAPPAGLLPAPEGARFTFVAGPPLEEAFAEADAILVWHGRGRDIEAAWPAAGRVRWIHAASAGVDKLLTPAILASEVVVTNSRGVFDGPMAEYALALMLHFAADLGPTLEAQRERRWAPRQYRRLAGRTVVVVGAGPIGRAVGRLAQAFGMTVRLVGRTARPDPEWGRIEAAADLASLLPEAAFVILVAPATPETHGLFGPAQFAALGPGAVLVNIGRGALVEEGALLEALRSGRLGGAALDVFAEEPLPAGHPLWSEPGVLVSPHMAGDFAGFEVALLARFREELEAWLAGRPLRNVVDKQAGYVRSADPGRRSRLA